MYKQLNEMLPERLRPTIISAIGRIHLLLGDVGAAKECFTVVTSAQPDQEHLQNQLNRFVLICMAAKIYVWPLVVEASVGFRHLGFYFSVPIMLYTLVHLSGHCSCYGSYVPLQLLYLDTSLMALLIGDNIVI